MPERGPERGALLRQAVAARRGWLAAAVVLACAALLAVRTSGLEPGHIWAEPVLAAVSFMLAFALGVRAGWAWGLAGTAAITVSLQIATVVFNPFLEMITLGPWLAGRVVASRRRLAGQLKQRNTELAAEREAFAAESVRYERARIARELHDIVAHNISLIVLQAGAGRRLAERSATGAADSLDVIEETARQAFAEVGRLASFLAAEPAGAGPVHLAPAQPSEHADPARLATVCELIRRARAAGLPVTCHLLGDCSAIGAEVAGAVYRVVQEGLTNALKHAPGATMDITIRAEPGQISVEVVNGPPAGMPSPLARSGGGHGLAGMHARVGALGGTLRAGPGPDGNWRVSALLPRGDGHGEHRSATSAQ